MDVEEEPRPRLHVTPPSGWLNDPVGGLTHGDRQHLFFQYVPASTRWQLDCHWGHLVGDDLVRWRHLPVALAPGDGDDGVWSGSAVIDSVGPVLLYTSVVNGSHDLGRIALARPLDDDLVAWRKHAGNPVLEPPPDLDLIHYRDPFVWGRPGDWSMLVGAGLSGGGGAALRYTSPDLEAWQFQGIFAAGTDGSLGETWECPQYVDLDSCRALVVSVWDGGALTRVAAACGTERDGTFAPSDWETLGYGGAAYALTTYRDRNGRLAATAWLRHEGTDEHRAGWSGMLSLPLQLSARAGGGVHVAPHPDVDTLRQEPLGAIGGTVDLDDGGATGGVADLEVALPAGAQLRLETTDRPVLLAAADTGLMVESTAGTACVPTAAGSTIALRVVVDRGAIEAWTPDGRWVALRLPHLHVRRAQVGGAGQIAAWRVEPVQAHTHDQ
ncbi:MAG: glycoside hydrolase family 32 protein [Mycobacteriales bacterium]